MLYYSSYYPGIVPKSTTITQEAIIDTAFEMVRKEGFGVLSARSIAKQIGCSTQPIYCCYKNMGDLKIWVISKLNSAKELSRTFKT